MEHFLKKIGVTVRGNMKNNESLHSLLYEIDKRENEIQIFSFIPSQINEEAAKILINIDDTNSSEFQKSFKKALANGRSRMLDLSRCEGFLSLGECGVRTIFGLQSFLLDKLI